VVIRRETPGDRAAVDAVISTAFGRPGSDQPPRETALVQALRRDVGWIESLPLVATCDRRIAGHVVCTRGWVGDVGVLRRARIDRDPRHYRRVILSDGGRAELTTVLRDARLLLSVPAIASSLSLLVLGTIARARRGT
jgi:hypothetical protein